MKRREFIKSGLALGIMTASPVLNACGSRIMRRPLVIGQIALSFHVASAAVVRLLVEKCGVKTMTKEATHEQMYGMLAKGEVDMVVSAWLPGSHGIYINPIEDKIQKLTVLYEPYALWGVPDYVPETEVAEVADLTRPEAIKNMRKRIQGIGAGAGISRFSREIMERYGLAKHGYEFFNGSLQDCTSAFEESVARKEWIVVPLWQPQFLHYRYKIRELREPFGLLRGKDEATLVIRNNGIDTLSDTALDLLRKLHLGNAAVSELDYEISVLKKTPEEAAARWLSEWKEFKI